SADDTRILDEAKDSLSKIIPKKNSLNIEGGNFTTVFEYGVKSHFETINIKKYKKLKHFEINNLNRINIFAGFNNTAKTTFLEAVYLLTQRNDMASHFKLIRQKNKFSSLSPVFLNSVFQDPISIEGRFNGVDVSVHMEKFDEPTVDKKDDYIASYKLTSQIDSIVISNLVHTYVHESMIRISDQVSHLCSSSFKSPYFYDIDDSISDYNRSVELKITPVDGLSQTAINLVIEFMKRVEDSIVDIRYTEEMDVKRFLVESKHSLERSFDLTTYGEGIQRIFYIALAFASCRNGVILIDEFETAIHFSLLKEFTRLTQELAETFNVQVFLTSHSRECIEAFVENGYKTEQVTGFQMINSGNKISSKRVEGERFKYLIENIALDIRG
ncbi:AAA family ATPase, partial [Cronobacter sakazakii]